MANKTNCVINGIPYYRIRRKVGIKQNKKGKWVPDMKPFYGKNKTDAEGQWEEWKENHKSGINKDEYISILLQYYIANVFLKGKNADGTKIRYNGVYKKYLVGNDILNQNRMNGVCGMIIQDLFNSFPGDMTYSTKIAIRNILTLFFKWAKLQGYCENPMDIIAIGKNEKEAENNEIIVFTREEIGKIVKSKPACQHSYNRFLIRFALGTGLREGELLGLTYGNIVDGNVKVLKQAITNVEKKRVIDGTKTSNSVRLVPIPDALKGELEERRKEKKDSDHIFLSRKGNLMDASNLNRSYRRFLKSIGVQYKKPHALRATYATTLLEKGVDIARVAELLGDEVETVAKYYAFVSDKRKIEAVDKINELFL